MKQIHLLILLFIPLILQGQTMGEKVLNNPHETVILKTFLTKEYAKKEGYYSFMEATEEQTLFILDGNIITIDDGIQKYYFTILKQEIHSGGEDVKWICRNYQNTLYTVYVDSEDHLIEIEDLPDREDMVIRMFTYYFE